MANSDTNYGLYNKHSREIKIYRCDNNEVKAQNFGGNVETAKSFFFTDDALDCFNTNATQLAWAITDDGNGIKFTIAFGIPKNPASTSWADAWKNTNQSLQDAGNWIKSSAYNWPQHDTNRWPTIWKSESVDSHLF